VGAENFMLALFIMPLQYTSLWGWILHFCILHIVKEKRGRIRTRNENCKVLGCLPFLLGQLLFNDALWTGARCYFFLELNKPMVVGLASAETSAAGQPYPQASHKGERKFQ